jgi:diguanylate cyclase (GGDEF)-like protein
LPIAPESLAACQLKPKQNILVVGDVTDERCNMVELEAPFDIVRKNTTSAASAWLSEQSCCPDVILLDYESLEHQSMQFCRELKQDQSRCHIAVIFLLPKLQSMLEMEAFDVGATDVYFDLSNPKVCQARLDAQLRIKQNATLLDALARIDHLTELANRGEFDRQLEDEWYHAQRSGLPLSIVMFDIDFFKLYNDHYGHQMGDDCLRQSAKAMASRVVRHTDFLARYGGEEFVVICSQTDAKGVMKIADEIRARVEAIQLPHAKSNVSDFVTLSGGVATLTPTKDTSPSTLLALADAALYRAKQQGRNRICR